MKQRIVLHGADTFVGVQLLQALALCDWVDVLPVSSLDGGRLRSALADAHGVVHCAIGDADRVRRAAALLYEESGPQSAALRWVHVGSMSVYGSATGRVNEQAPLLADLGEYSQAQLWAEQRAATLPNSIILRCGVEYGPGCPHWSLRIAQLLLSYRLGDLGDAGDGCCNLLYIEDLARAVERSLSLPGVPQIAFNLADATELTWNDYFIAFAMALSAVPVRRIGARRLKLEAKVAPLLKLLEMAAKPLRLRTPPPLTPSMLASCRQELRLDVQRAQRELDLQCTELATALKYTASWSRTQLGLPAPAPRSAR